MAKTSLPIQAIILAAGKGTRMKSVREKVLHEIAGRSMLAYVLETVKSLKAVNTSVVLANGMKAVEAEVARCLPKAKIAIQQKQLGTADAVKSALKHMGKSGITFILYGDTPFISPATLQRMIDAIQKESHAALAVLGFTPANAGEYGRLVLGDFGMLNAIVEYKEASEAERAITLCNSGVMAVRSELLDSLLSQVKNDNSKGEYYLTDLVKIARVQGYACVVAEADELEVMGINNRAELAVGESIVQQRLREAAMLGGATLISAETIHLRHDTKIGKDVVIHPYVVFGDGVKVEDDVEIKSFSHIDQAIIKKNAVVGPYARIRPGAEIGEGAHIGNFVEIKKSKIGKGAKINHLSYVGDADVGANSNIGAGTITCNYDGVNKHKTVIGEDAFIGSNTSLVAPVKVGKGAITGAGSTILKDVPAGGLAINAMPQKNVVGRAQALRKSKPRKKK